MKKMHRSFLLLLFLFIVSNHSFLYSQSNDKQEIKKETVKKTTKKTGKKTKNEEALELQLQEIEKEKAKIIEEKEAAEKARLAEIEKMQKEMAEMEFLLKQKETLEASMKQQEIQSGFVQSMFFTFQFGGGSMLSAGAGLSFFSNVVRPEVLAGYSPSGEYKSLSFAAKLNARILGIKITESSGFFATIGANFTFFSGNAKIAPSAFLAQEFDFKDVLFMSTFTFYFEENFYFIENKEGSVLFQLGIGIRMSIF